MGVANFTTRAPKTMTLINNRNNNQIKKPGAPSAGLNQKIGTLIPSGSGKPPIAVTQNELTFKLL